jgi:carbon storage regulator
MLVLTRKTNEQIMIGEDVRVVVLGVQGNRVRLGFIAPGDVTIQRAELESLPAPEDAPADSPSQRQRRYSLV